MIDQDLNPLYPGGVFIWSVSTLSGSRVGEWMCVVLEEPDPLNGDTLVILFTARESPRVMREPLFNFSSERSAGWVRVTP